ncbi:MAG: hypothetical protein ABI430_00540, partial [Candidatus Taylorbacteria bacterium]
KLVEKFPSILSFSMEENIKPKLVDLENAGFSNPVTLIEKNPNILGYSFDESIKPKLADLKNAGFENPVKLVEKFPSILSFSMEENIKPKLVDLKNAGFVDPIALIEKNPQILGNSFDESIKPKLADLKIAGFENPVKLVEKFPQILSLSMEENTIPKLSDLKNAGFVDPVALIEKSPSILGLSMEENIKPKLELAQIVIDTYGITTYKAPEIFETFPQLFGLKRVKMEIVARVLRDKVEAPKDLTPKQLARIFIRPIEDIVLSYPTSGDKKMFLNELVKKVKESSKNKDKNAKRQKIEALLERDANGKVILGDPLTNIVLKYLRDYPEKKGGKKI